jgi:hypothetical protein
MVLWREILPQQANKSGTAQTANVQACGLKEKRMSSYDEMQKYATYTRRSAFKRNTKSHLSVFNETVKLLDGEVDALLPWPEPVLFIVLSEPNVLCAFELSYRHVLQPI